MITQEQIKTTIEKAESQKQELQELINSLILIESEQKEEVRLLLLKEHEKELNMLRNILKETEDREFYVSKIHTVESQITELNEKLKYAVSPDDAIMKHIEEIIDSNDLEEVLDEMISANSGGNLNVNLNEKEKESLVKAAIGLTLQEAENAFAIRRRLFGRTL